MNMDTATKFSFSTATAGRACGFKVDRSAWTIDGIPIPGAKATVEVDGDQGRRHTASRVAAGVVGGAVFLPLALVGLTRKSNKRHVYVTVTGANGIPSTKIVPISKHKQVLGFANAFNLAAASRG